MAEHASFTRPRARFWKRLGPSRRPLTWAGIFLALVIVVVMHRLLVFGGLLIADDIWTSDLLNNNVPPRAWLGQELRAGRFPLWLPDSYGGLPMVPQGEAAATNPITWVLYALFDRVTATALTVAIHTWIAGFGTVLLARRFGARTLGATAVGVAFMFCGFLVEHVKHMNMHHAAAFLPWMVYAVDRVRERPGWRTALPFGVLSALQLSEGHPQMCYVSAFVILPVLVYRLASARRAWPPRRLFYALRLGGALGLAGLVVLVLSGAYLAAGFELYALSERGADTVDRWDFCTRFEFFWENIATLGWAHVFGNGANATYDPRHGMFWESWLYVGVLPCAAAVLAIFTGVRHALARRWRVALPIAGWTLLAGLAFSLMLGKNSSVYALAFHHVPGMTWFRFPQRFALVLELAVLLLAARGLDALVNAVQRRGGVPVARALGVLLLGVVCVDIVYIMMGHFHAVPRQVAFRPPATVQALRKRAPAEPWRLLPLFGSETHGEAFGAARGWQRWRPYVPQWAVVQPSTHLYWGIESVTGYTSMVPFGVAHTLGSHNAIGVLSGPRTIWADKPKDCAKRPLRFTGACAAKVKCHARMARAYGAFNVRYLLSPGPLTDCPGWVLRETIEVKPYTMRLYENQNVLPRAYVVDGVVDVATVREAAEALVRHDVDPAHTVTRLDPTAAGKRKPPRAQPTRTGDRLRPAGVASAPASAPAGQPFRPCEYTSLGPDARRVRCELDEPGHLVIADTFYPGMQVRLNGAPATPFAAHGIQMGLDLPAGTHEVTVEFRPRYAPLVPLGAAGWAALLAIGVGLRGRRIVRRIARRRAHAGAR